MRRGFAAFILIIPIVILAIMLVISYAQIEKEHYQSQLTTLKVLRQREIDESITKSFKELLIYYNENEVEKLTPCDDVSIPDEPIPVPGKVSKVAMKISGFIVSDKSTWIGFIQNYYAKEGVNIEFNAELTSTGISVLPLTPTIIDGKEYIGISKTLFTCNPESFVITNGWNGKITKIYSIYTDSVITYKVNDTINDITWTRTIKYPLYEKSKLK